DPSSRGGHDLSSNSARATEMERGAVMPRRTCCPFTATTVTRMLPAMTISSPIRRVRTNMTHSLLVGSLASDSRCFKRGSCKGCGLVQMSNLPCNSPISLLEGLSTAWRPLSWWVQGLFDQGQESWKMDRLGKDVSGPGVVPVPQIAEE